ncbi:MAG: FtsX-like permease family protein [Promethearchaeota archaeon]
MDLNLTYSGLDTSLTDVMTNIQITFIGIDDWTAQYLSESKNQLYSNFKYNGEHFSNSAAIFGLSSNFTHIFDQLELNLNDIEDRMINITNEINYELINDSLQIPYLEPFSIYNPLKFGNIIGKITPINSDVVIVMNRDMIETIKSSNPNILLENSYDYECFLLDHEKLLSYTPTQILDSIEALTKIFNENEMYSSPFDSFDFTWYAEVEGMVDYLQNYIIFSLMFYLPVLFFGIKFLSNTLNQYIIKLRREIGLLLVHGMQKTEILQNFLIYFGSIAFIGGFFGSILGFYFSNIIIENLFPAIALGPQNYLGYYDNLLLWNTIITSLISIIFVSFPVIRTYLINFKGEVQEVLKYQNLKEETSEEIINFDKMIIYISLIGIIAVGTFFLVYRTNDTSFLVYSQIGLYFIFKMCWPVLLCFPLIFPASCIRFLAYHLKRMYKVRKEDKFDHKARKNNKNKKSHIKKEKRTEEERKYFLFRFFKKKFLYNLMHDQNYLQIFVGILLLVNIFSTLNYSYDISIDITKSKESANGNIVHMNIIENKSFSKMDEFQLSLENDITYLDIYDYNAVYYTGYNQDYASSSKFPIFSEIQINSSGKSHQTLYNYRFATTNFSKLFDLASIMDDWFVNESVSMIKTKLIQDNAILIPEKMLDQNFSINEEISINYIAINGEIINKTGIIVGAYKFFPSIYSDNDFFNNNNEFLDNYNIILHPKLLENAICHQIDHIFYCPPDFSDKNIYILKELMEDVYDFNYILDFENFEMEFNSIEILLVKYIRNEINLLIILSIFGYFLYKRIFVDQTSYEFALLHSRGFSREDIGRISILQSIFTGFAGIVLICIFLLEIPWFFNALNQISLLQNISYLYWHINWSFLVKSLIIGYLLYISINYLSSKQNIADIRPKKEMERILRRFH